MKILKLHKLNKQQIKEVESLVQVCIKNDGLERTIYLDNDVNFFVNLSSFFLLYINNRLVSVLAIYEPLEEEAEITAYTLPLERKKGYFKILFHKALEELERFNLHRILFVTEPAGKSGISAVKALGADYEKSEYLLIYEFKDYGTGKVLPAERSEKEQEIQLRELTCDKKEAAAKLSSRIFNTEKEETLDVIELALNSKYMKCYYAFINHKMAGICNISFGAKQASIFGFGISPEYQGKGYGRGLLKLVMQLIRSGGSKAVTLHVGSENKEAYHLYTSEKFIIQTQYDYYKYRVDLHMIPPKRHLN